MRLRHDRSKIFIRVMTVLLNKNYRFTHTHSYSHTDTHTHRP